MSMLWALLIISCSFVKSEIVDVNGIKQELKIWLSSALRDLERLKPPQQSNLCPNFIGSTSYHEWTLLNILDTEQFSFDGIVEENGKPVGSGTLTKLAKNEQEIVCFKSMCHCDIQSVTGNFSHGLVNGKGRIIYQDGRSLKTSFNSSVPFGGFLMTDKKNRHFSIGVFDKGQRVGNLWFHDYRTGHRFYGSANGQGCFFLASSVICGSMQDFLLRDGHKCTNFWNTRNEIGMMEISPIQCETDSKALNFGNATNFQAKEDRLSAQLLWLHLKYLKKPESIFLNGLTLEKNASKSQRLITNMEEVSLQSIQCKGKLDLFQLPKNSVMEHLGLSYPGSGSKWIFQSISLFTGIKDCYLWLEHEPLYERRSASIIKSHHQRAEMYQKITPDVNRKSETMVWRLDHIYNFGGRAIILVRNPYDSILAHWNHVLAGELELAREYLKTLHSEQFLNFVKIEIKLWLEILLDWIPISSRVMILHFEEFKRDVSKELLRVNKYLGLEPDLTRLACVSTLENSLWQRKKRPKVKRKNFPLEIINLFDDTIDQARLLLKEYGFEDLPTDQYKIYRKP
ncbi:hypothetical protein TCAL_14836 [Tigriopus californicus]|uniref:Sulfotransferase domain-containing protein n=1 Tax=Tigriopus californicus TaxID=6832 RepID=A0A553PPC4_TIGCA|nr:sialate:O-sulfotransferase 2-like [Tigriopus californicus]TRY79536.1 hypothetical protein TCAL_14836 [Tigriopus californicus]